MENIDQEEAVNTNEEDEQERKSLTSSPSTKKRTRIRRQD